MAKEFRYVLPVEQTQWTVEGESSTVLRWDYDNARGDLLALYDKGKARQWDAASRIDWSQDLDPENPVGIDDRFISIYGSDIWQKLTAKERANLRRHTQAWQFSQFLHGEQGALVCAAKIVEAAPGIDAKFYAATQVMDEARHVEAFSRLLREKFDLAYPIMPPLKALLDDVVSDRRWDMTFLGMQVLIEGLALAAFQLYRDNGTNALARSVNAYVMEDEARHVAFGRLGAARLLSAAFLGRAARARGVRRRGLISHARPLPRRRFVGRGRPAESAMPRVRPQFGNDAGLSRPPVQPHRADHPRHRPPRPRGQESLCRDGRPRLCRNRSAPHSRATPRSPRDSIAASVVVSKFVPPSISASWRTSKPKRH